MGDGAVQEMRLYIIYEDTVYEDKSVDFKMWTGDRWKKIIKFIGNTDNIGLKNCLVLAETFGMEIIYLKNMPEESFKILMQAEGYTM